MTVGSLPPVSLQFRRFVIDRLWPPHAGQYIDASCFVGRCPVCGGPIGVRFAGLAPRASLNCHQGCSEAEVAAKLDLVMRP